MTVVPIMLSPLAKLSLGRLAATGAAVAAAAQLEALSAISPWAVAAAAFAAAFLATGGSHTLYLFYHTFGRDMR